MRQPSRLIREDMAHSGAAMNVDEMQALVKENATLRAHLEDLLEGQDQVSEASIREDYTRICEAIDRWVDNVTVYDNKDDFKRRYLEVLHDKKRPPVLTTQDFDLKKLVKYDYADHFVLPVVVQDQLARHIFQSAYPVGITDDEGHFLWDVQDCMRRTGKGMLMFIGTISF